MGLRTYVRARACVYVQSIYLVGGGLIIEANIPVQEFEGQRGEGAYFWEDTVYVFFLDGYCDFLSYLLVARYLSESMQHCSLLMCNRTGA